MSNSAKELVRLITFRVRFENFKIIRKLMLSVFIFDILVYHKCVALPFKHL